ncbi:NAD(P)/FAD-dependent oxidoreductase [Pseudonocardia pini]|uniref:NAD(P)/FAD-dependent oxidoreductase n=1 Tax=Pseudonocardia pini TaxID=2758030 RepID=UPI0015F0CA58|nr:FAD-dependent oxidoreductase [Pseudonocardia pini]
MVETTGTADVVVVGGGIAGSALATVLAREGRDVLLLEKETAYRDKVRGEFLSCWGVEEALRLGLEDVLLGAGGGYATRMAFYDENSPGALGEAAAVPLDELLPGVPGALDVGHPQACEALIGAAAAAGARVVRGIRPVDVTPGEPPAVRYVDAAGAAHSVVSRLVVGADGRQSGVRRAAGIDLEVGTPRTMGGGMLVDGLADWPADRAALGTEGDLYYLMFPRANGRARLYLLHDVRQRGRFAGPDRAEAFLRAYQLDCIPDSGRFGAATPAGPCAFYPMTDSWTVQDPVAPGVVLVGDAAGWNDPVIGQGLAIALRDARTVAELVLAGEGLEPYVAERRERMRRLRISAAVVTDMSCTFTPEGAARRAAYGAARSDPVLGGPRMAVMVGPERMPAEAFEARTVARIRALA